ncbi:HP1 family phage holin [Paraburkholderia caribensis]|uniref:HP1 family phage holin n=1 Tax=Paraburkholderia caribensis TaxID=75105 RepID=UPI0020913B99|nr:HP1 family phage holin [Paraburkholderia caribensis]MCO4879057.1 HP1 family phage holin [Paraburkholderia caribensis]
MRLTPEAAASYAGAAASVSAGFTLQDYGVIVGIFTALVTCVAHIYFSSKRIALDEKLADAKIAELQSHGDRE